MNNHSSSSETTKDPIDVFFLVQVLWRERLIVIAITVAFAVLSVFVALSIPNTYTAQAKLVPTEESEGGGLASLARQFGSVASLAGVNLGGTQPGKDKVLIALETLKSRKFSQYFIEKYNLRAPLMAADDWDYISRELSYDDDIYDAETGTWVRDVDPPATPEPSDWEAHEVFNKRLLVKQDEMTDIVHIGFTHESPILAKQWVDWLILEINELIRQSDIEESQLSIAFLEEQIQETELAEMRDVFYQLIQSEMQKSMLASVREEYVFSVIDPAVEPEQKSGPNRPLICFVITLLGGLIALVIALVKEFRFNRSGQPVESGRDS